MNAITIYFLQRIVDFHDIANLIVEGLVEYVGVLGPLVLPLSALTLKWLFLSFLYRHKLFFKL